MRRWAQPGPSHGDPGAVLPFADCRRVSAGLHSEASVQSQTVELTHPTLPHSSGSLALYRSVRNRHTERDDPGGREPGFLTAPEQLHFHPCFHHMLC